MEWVGNHTKLVSRWRHEAKQFLRTILTIIMKESKQSGLIPEDRPHPSYVRCSLVSGSAPRLGRVASIVFSTLAVRAPRVYNASMIALGPAPRMKKADVRLCV